MYVKTLGGDYINFKFQKRFMFWLFESTRYMVNKVAFYYDFWLAIFGISRHRRRKKGIFGILKKF